MKGVTVLVSFAIASCASPSPSSSSPAPTSSAPFSGSTKIVATNDTSSASSSSPSAPTTSTSTTPPSKKPTNDELFARLRSDFTGCYEAGKKEVPTMASGRVTLHASIDRSGKTTCAVPSDDSGLTQDVEDCMRRRLGRESYSREAAPWSAVLPIVVENGTLGLGKPTSKPLIETIESHGLAEDMYEVVERILPELRSCISGAVEKSSELRVLYIGAEVGKDGKVVCALASSPSAVPDTVRDCAASTLGKATFKAPKRGYGLISIPLEVLGKK